MSPWKVSVMVLLPRLHCRIRIWSPIITVGAAQGGGRGRKREQGCACLRVRRDRIAGDSREGPKTRRHDNRLSGSAFQLRSPLLSPSLKAFSQHPAYSTHLYTPFPSLMSLVINTHSLTYMYTHTQLHLRSSLCVTSLMHQELQLRL